MKMFTFGPLVLILAFTLFLRLRESAGTNAKHATGRGGGTHVNARSITPPCGRDGTRLLKANRQDRVGSLAALSPEGVQGYNELESRTRSS